MTKWEYKIERSSAGLSQSRLNSIGAEGWELVQVIKISNMFEHLFKRPCDKQPAQAKNCGVMSDYATPR